MRRGHNRRVWIEKAFLVGSKSKFDERPRIRKRLCLPPIFFLVPGQSGLGRLVEGARRFTGKVVLANQGMLNLPGAFRVDALLCFGLGRLPAFGLAVV